MPDYPRVKQRPHSYNKTSVRILIFLLLAPILPAQDRAQFVWQGEVDGIDILYLHADRLDATTEEKNTRHAARRHDHR